MRMFELTTARLSILPFDKRYLREYFEQFTPEITALQYPDPFQSIEQAESFLDGFLLQMERGEMLELMLLTREGRFLGSFEVFGLKEKKPEVGLWLRGDVHGNGYGFEALQAVLEELGRRGCYEACIYEADRRNLASLALVRKFGARELCSSRVTTETGKELDLIPFEIAL